jgi:ubiquitin-protein ligase E3 C
MEHCRLLVSSSSVRRLFHCAIDQSVLKTKETLQSKTDRDLKQEKEFEEAGVSAVSLAAKEARIDRSKTFWNSSSWARKVSSGVSKMLSGDSTSAETPSLIKNPSSPRPDKASGSSSTESKRTSYSSDLFMVLCRLYGIVLARWGGFGGEDVVRRVQSYSTKIQKNEATRTADVCSQSLLNVLCFSTSIVQASWGLIQAEKGLSSSANAVIHPTKEKLPVRCLSIRPRYGNGKKDQTKNDALALLFVFVSALAHTLIVTDDTEIHDMEKPLPLHQLRRYTITVLLTCALASCEFSNFCFGKMCRNFETTPIPSLLGRRRGECKRIRI